MNIIIMGQDMEKWLPLNAIPLKEAGFNVIVCDGGSVDGTQEICEKYGITFIQNIYNHSSKTANCDQRNYYLDYLKTRYDGELCLVLDADEVVEPDSIKDIGGHILLSYQSEHIKMFGVHMEHFVGNLANVDATVQKHFVQRRLFIINKHLEYQGSEHALLRYPPNDTTILIDKFTIWHLGYLKGLMHMPARYKEQLEKSEIHSPEFLQQWYRSHILGQYPVRPFDITKLPPILKKHFKLETIDSEVYFANRMNLEKKFFDDINAFNKFFDKSKNWVFLGCGAGQRVYLGNQLTDKICVGIELDDWVVKNSPWSEDVAQGDITNPSCLMKNYSDVIFAYDVLEHLDYYDMEMVLENINEWLKKDGYVLISVPVIGDPNLEADHTHIIKETKDWWIDKISSVFDIIPTPSYFPYKHQIIIGKKK